MIPTAAIVNPRSRNGKTGSEWPGIARLLRDKIGLAETWMTRAPGHATVLARELLHQGFEHIIAAGGDGTISEIANGFLDNDAPIRPGASLGILPLGTGGDYIRTLGIPRRLDDAIDALAEGAPTRLDMGKASYCNWNGARQSRYFVNLVSFGMGGEVASRSTNILNPLGGTVSFLYATAVAFFVYRKKQVRLRLDDSTAPLGFDVYNIAVGNGRFHGAGMQACPTAMLNDGVLEVTVIEFLRRLEAILDFPVLYSDNVYRHPKVKHLRAKKLLAEADEEVRIEIDGEPVGTLPLEIYILPQVLSVIVPRSSPLLNP